MKTLKELQKEINDWQDSVFTKATPLSAATHLQREIIELVEIIQLYKVTQDYAFNDPVKLTEVAAELADCQILLAGVAHLLNLDLETVTEDKMVINRRRVWGEPDSEGVVEHVRDIAQELNDDLTHLTSGSELVTHTRMLIGLSPDQINMLEDIVSGDE